MASHKEKYTLTEDLESVQNAMREATQAMKWRVVTDERTHFVIKELAFQGESLNWPVTIDVKLIPLSEGIGIEWTASNMGFGGAQSERVQTQSDNFLKYVRRYFERIIQAQQKEENDRLEEQRREERRAADEAARLDRLARMKAAEEDEANRLALLNGASVPDEADENLSDGAADDESSESQSTLEKLGWSVITPSTVADTRRAPPSTYEIRGKKEVDQPAPPKLESVDTSSSGSSSSSNIVADLEKLAKLREIGALTDDEFTQAKRKLLNL